MQKLIARLALRAREICFDLWYHRAIPGYEDLPWPLRCRLNWLALGGFLISAEFLRLVLYLAIWLLGGFSLVWNMDQQSSAALWPITTACCWLLPWVATVRRQRINRLLGGRWPLR